MNLGLDGKVAVVAAASRGIGRAVAHQLSEEGAGVAICARGEDDLHDAVESCPGPAIGVQADVRETADLQTLIEDTLEAFGGIDVVVNNAGGPPPGGFQEVGPEDFEAALQLNLLSTIRLTQLALPHLKEAEGGRVINITSVTAKEPKPDLALSNTARSAVLGAAKTLSREVAPEGITVNSVLPGSTGTERMVELTRDKAERRGISYEEAQRESAGSIPMDRWGTPREIADVVTFLASERASFVTGCAIPVDGGYTRSLY